MKMSCPRCQAVVGVPASPPGKATSCPRCGATVPLPPSSAAAPRSRRFRWAKVVLILVLAVGLLRLGYVIGWRAAGHRLADAGLVDKPTRPHPRTPKRAAMVEEARLRAQVAAEEALRGPQEADERLGQDQD